VSDQSAGSDLLEIVKRNGDFRKNYGTIIGGYLFLRSITAAAGRSVFHRGNRWFGLAAQIGLVFSATAILPAAGGSTVGAQGRVVPRAP
jgi:hypothetical protein